MRCGWACVIVAASAVTSFADPRVEIDLGATVEHLSGGTCSGGGFSGPCGGHWAEGVRVDAGQTWEMDPGSSAVARELVGVDFAHSGFLVHGFLGAGARWNLSPRFYTELTLGL